MRSREDSGRKKVENISYVFAIKMVVMEYLGMYEKLYSTSMDLEEACSKVVRKAV